MMSINETKDNSRLKQGFKSFVWLAVMFQILVILLPSVAAADDALFITAVGGGSNEEGYSVAQTSDGGYVVTGKSPSYGDADDDLLLIKFDSSGAEEWTKTIGGTSTDVGYSVVQTFDGGYIVTGTTYGEDISDDLLLVKFNSSGAAEWTKTVGGTSTDKSYSVVQTSDGGYVATGFTYRYGGEGIYVWLIKFNSSGAVEWIKTVGDTGSSDVGNSVAQTSDGGYIVTGSTTNSAGAGGTDVLLVKFNSSGAVEWTKTVGGTSADVGNSVAQTSDGGYIVTGQSISYSGTGYDLLFVKFDSSGAEEWTKIVGGDSSDFGRSVVQTSDGGYVVAGYSASYGDDTGYDVLLVKFNSSGAVEWTKTVGGESGDFGRSVVQTSDGGYVVTGDTNSYDAGGSDILLIRVDANGECGECSELADEDVTEENWNDVVKGNWDVTEENWDVTEIDHSMNESSHDPSEDVFCYGLIPTLLPIYSGFTSIETTNFSEEANLTAIKNLTLATEKGKIRFGEYGINAESADFDNNVKIENSIIFVNTSALHSSFNDSATLTFYNVNCNAPYVYYSDTANTRAAILTENKLCLPPRCTNIQCSAGTLTVDVAHFSGYAVNGTANLTIDADDPKYPLETVTFTAEYMNATGPITGATCNISFSDGSYIMDEQATYYNYSRTFDSAQIVDYNVTCSATEESTVFANDTAVIQSIDIPEFSIITLGLGLIAVLGGLLIIRRKM